MRRCMRTDACSASMLWGLQSAAIYDFGSWVSIENFAYSLCRTSANCIIFHSCDWTLTPPEAIKCFTKMLERAGIQAVIPPEGDHLFVYRHSLHPKVTQETNISFHREKKLDGFDVLLCTFTTYSLRTPLCPVLEYDQRTKDKRTGKYETDLKQAYNRYESNEIKEQLAAAGKLVTK